MPATDASPLPAIIGVNCAADGSIAVLLDSAPSPPLTAAVFKGLPEGTGWLDSSETQGARVLLSVDRSTLDPNQGYYVALTAQPSTPVWGQAVEIVFQALSQCQATVNQRNIELWWSVPQVNNFADVRALLYDQTVQVFVADERFLGLSGTLALPGPLDSTHRYTITVYGEKGVAAGPEQVTDALILDFPTIAGLTYSVTAEAKADIVVQAAKEPPPELSLVLGIAADGRQTAQTIGQGARAEILLAVPLSPWSAWRAFLRYTRGPLTGPPGFAWAIPVEQPVITRTEWDGTQYSVAWDVPAPGYVEIRKADGTVAGSAMGWGAVQITPAAPPDPNAEYQAFAAAWSSGARGPFSLPARVIVRAPQVTALVYDGARLTAALAGQPAGARASLVQVMSGDDVIAAGVGGLGSVLLHIQLDSAAAYSMRVRPTDGPAVGPPSARLAIAVAAPSVGGLAVSETSIDGTVTLPPTQLEQPFAEALLYEGRQCVAGPVQSDASGHITFPGNFLGRRELGVRARVRGASAGRQVTGPFGSPARVLACAPEVGPVVVKLVPPNGSVDPQFSFDVSLAVAERETATGFTVTLQQAGATVWQETSCTDRITFSVEARKLDASMPAAVFAQASGLSGVGPLSAAVSFVLWVPVLNAACDGKSVRVSLAWARGSAAPCVSAYWYLLFKRVGGGWSPLSSSGPRPGEYGILAIPDVPADVALGVGADVVCGNVRTHTGAVVAVIRDAPALLSVAATGTTATLRWSRPPSLSTVKRYTAILRVPGYPAITQEVTGETSATVDLSKLPTLLDATVELAARDQLATGPSSNAVRIMSDPVTALSATVDSGSVLVDFGVPPGRARDYLAVVSADDGAPISQAAGPLPPIAVAAPEPAPGKTYSVAVTPRRACAAGPPSSLKLVLAAPTLTAASFDGRVLAVTFSAPAAGTAAIDSYDLTLERNGTAVQRIAVSVPASGQPLAMTIDHPVDPTASYRFHARARAGAAAGPFAAAGVLLGSPAVSAITCADRITATVAAGDLPPDGLTLEAVLYTDGQPGTPQAVDPDGTVAFDIPPGKAVAVAARGRAAAATGPWSVPAPAPAAAPAITAAAYCGGRLSLTWTGNPRGTFRVEALGGSSVVAETVVQGLSAILPLISGASCPCSVHVTEIAGVATGPFSTLDIVAAGCVLQSAAVDAGRQITIKWQAPSCPAAISGFQPVLLRDGIETALALQPKTATSATLPLPAELPPGASIAVRALNGVAAGPLGAALPVLVSVPVGLRLQWDGAALSAAWEPTPDGAIDGYIATLLPDGKPPVTQRTAAPSIRLQYPMPDPPVALSFQVAAVAGAASGPPSPALHVITEKPAVRSASFDGSVARAAWEASGDASVTGYLAVLSAGGTPMAQSVVTATQIELPAPAGSGALSLAVSAVNAASTGPAGTPVELLTAGAVIAGADTDPFTGATTISWSAVPGAASYLAQLFRGGVADGDPIPSTATRLVLPHPLMPGADLAAAVAPAGGPYGPQFQLPTAQPAVARVEFNGSSLLVEWTPAPGATGYVVSVLAAGATTPTAQARTGPGEAQARFPVTADTAKTYTVVVQAAVNGNAGPPSTPRNIFEAGFFVGTPNGVLCLFPASTLALQPAPSTVYLPNIGALTGLPIAPKKEDAPTAPFTLEANADPASQATYPYKLTIANDACIFTADVVRADLQNLYRKLLTLAEKAGATPWGVMTLQQVIARLMPQTFAETLYYSYGFSTAGSIDLRPGAILRVAFSDYQQISGTTPPNWAIGYGGSAVIDYEICDFIDDAGQAWLVGFDAFLAKLAAAGLLSADAPETLQPPPIGPAFAESGGAEAADFLFPAFRQPFYRLFIPPKLQKANPPSEPKTAAQFAIAAAGAFGDLDTATTSPTATVAVAYFRGRAVLKVGIRVIVNGVEQVVPVGTTVGNLLDRLACRPPSAAIELRGVTLERPLGPAVLDPGIPFDAGSRYAVHLSWKSLATLAPPRDGLCLPLLHGDRLTIKP